MCTYRNCPLLRGGIQLEKDQESEVAESYVFSSSPTYSENYLRSPQESREIGLQNLDSLLTFTDNSVLSEGTLVSFKPQRSRASKTVIVTEEPLTKLSSLKYKPITRSQGEGAQSSDGGKLVSQAISSIPEEKHQEEEEEGEEEEPEQDNSLQKNLEEQTEEEELSSHKSSECQSESTKSSEQQTEEEQDSLRKEPVTEAISVSQSALAKPFEDSHSIEIRGFTIDETSDSVPTVVHITEKVESKEIKIAEPSEGDEAETPSDVDEILPFRKDRKHSHKFQASDFDNVMKARADAAPVKQKVDASTSIDKMYVGKRSKSQKNKELSEEDYRAKKKKLDKKRKKKKPPEFKYGMLIPPNRSPLKLLLVFPVQDQVYDALNRAAEKLSFEVTSATSDDGALEEYQAKNHDLVIIDARTSRNIDFDTLCRSIRNTRGSQHTVIAATVKRGVFEKDEVTVLSLLEAGFNRCLIESANVTMCVNELIQLKHSDIRPQAQHTTTQALYTAIDKCRDLVLITDDNFRLQYLNKANERYLGYRPEELLGKAIQDQVIYDPVQLNAVNAYISRSKEYFGPLALRRKGQDASVPASCKAASVVCAGRVPTHFVLVFETGSISDASQQRGSVHSIRRSSNDVRSVGSDYLRRTSLAKLNQLPLEAPITRIITLIEQTRETAGSNTQVVQLLDRIEDMLRTPELYSPHVKDDLRVKADEPIVSDLITALLSNQPQPTLSSTSRRSSNDSAIFRPSRTTIKVSSVIRDLLESSLLWEFDIFRLEELSKRRPLANLGMNLFMHFDAANVLNCDEKILYNWLTVIEANYHSDNHYHNSTHAADVMQATACFLEKERLKSIMEPLDEVTCLIAAAGHDVDHPGKSSAFLSNSDNPLAILYNDVTVLESHHAALTFKLTLGDDRVNVFKNLDRETYKIARHNIIDMILATEMTKHFEHLAKFVNVFCTKPTGSDAEIDVQEYVPVTLPENVTLIKRMMIKCADVSNPTRPMRLCIEWAIRIAEEYFQQTDEEKRKQLPVVMPMFDRATCSIPKSQIGFVDYIIHDMIEAWNAFIDMPELTNYMRLNYIKWKEFDEQGHTSLSDLEKVLRIHYQRPSEIATKKKTSE